jgi:hypothetical protein
MSNDLSNGNNSEEEALEVSVAKLDNILVIVLYSIVPLTLEKDLPAKPPEAESPLQRPRTSSFARRSGSLSAPPSPSRQYFPASYTPPMTNLAQIPARGVNVPTAQIQPTQNPQITLVLPDQCGNQDFDDLAPASILRDSNVVMFFNFFAQRTGLSIQSFECLTFRNSFAGNSVKIIHADDGNGAWEAFKRNLKRPLVYSRNKFPAKEFDIWVERGDTKGEVAGDDNGEL